MPQTTRVPVSDLPSDVEFPDGGEMPESGESPTFVEGVVADYGDESVTVIVANVGGTSVGRPYS